MILETGRDNTRLKERLEQIVRGKRISHAYLFEGPGDMDKEAFAKGFIKGVLCPKGLGENCGDCSICSKIDHGNHEDVSWFGRDGQSVKKAVASAIQEKISIRPVGGRNIVVVSDCDAMTAEAQNRLLKTLEEPPGDAVIILLAENMENLAPTILSRCVKFRIDAGFETTEDEKAGDLVRMALSGCRFHEIVHETGDYFRDGAKAAELLESMERAYRQLLLDHRGQVRTYKTEDLCRCIECIEEAKTRLKTTGMVPEFAMKELLLQITG